MTATIRQAVDSDLEVFIDFTLKLARYNRSKHQEECKYDDFTGPDPKYFLY